MVRGRRRIKVGIVANEFFDRRLGRMGGFGWAAAQVASCFRDEPDVGVDPTTPTAPQRKRYSPGPGP